MKNIIETLEAKGYILGADPDMGEPALLNGDRYILTSAANEHQVELMLFDDFSNPFKPEDFETVEEYADAIIDRFNDLWSAYIGE